MGSKLSIDKQVSKLEDLLELNTALLDIVKYESNIPDCITQHLKVTHAPQKPPRYGSSTRTATAASAPNPSTYPKSSRAASTSSPPNATWSS